MADEKKMATEIDDTEVEQIAGGGGVYSGHLIITGLTPKCGSFEAGSNFYNRKILAVSNTCGACSHMMYCDGWHVCDARSN